MRIEIEHLQRGQARSYAPHVYEARITIEGDKGNGPIADQVKHIVRGMVHSFTEEPQDNTMDSHFKPRLRKFELVEEDRGEDYASPFRQVWLARVEEPFCD